MIKLSSGVYAVSPGDVVQIAVTSVNMVNNSQLDPQLTPAGINNDFVKSGELTMGNAATSFAVTYSFPNPLPDGAKYTRTITGPGGFSDGPSDVLAAPGQTLVVLPYILNLAAATPAAAGAGQGSGPQD
jgi:hypothetical protein